jgi:hypothetical protein
MVTGRRLGILKLGLAAFICGAATAARGDVQVEGSQAALRVTARQDKIADILSALAATFDLQYRTTIPLDGTVGNSIYSGSLQQVLSRLLDGYNFFFIKKDQQLTVIVVLGKGGDFSIPPPLPSLPPAKGAFF